MNPYFAAPRSTPFRAMDWAQKKPGLTDRQKLVLDFVVACFVADGRCPTLREIGKAIGIRSTNGVDDHLHKLARKGYVVMAPLKTRSIQVIRLSDGTAVCGKYVFEKLPLLTE